MCGLVAAVAFGLPPGPASSGPEPRAEQGPVNVILDTDIGPDCGDIAAVAMLHGLADKGEANILATMNCIGGEWGPLCMDALNTYYGRPDVPVGTLKDDTFLAEHVSFNREVALHYPHRLKSAKDAPDATLLYRQILAKQPDRSVVVVAIGPLRALAKLLRSTPDAASPLGGRDLVAKKVSVLSCMGGWNPEAPKGWGPEWNFLQDANAAKDVCANWPTPIVFSDAALGSGLMTGRRVATDASEYNPMTLAFAHGVDVGFGHDRPSWDQTSILYAVRGPRNYFDETKGGFNDVAATGGNTFSEKKGGKHRYLVPKMPVSELEDVIEELMVDAREGPLNFDFNVACYSQEGMGTVTAKDEVAPAGVARHAFDRDPKSVWVAKSPASWIGYRCPDGKRYAVSKYRITSAFAAPENDPGSWTLSGSNDGGNTWTELDKRGPERFDGRGQTREFAFDNTSAYNTYRFDFAAARAVQVAGIELLEHIRNETGVPVTAIALDQSKVTIPVAGRSALNVSVSPRNARDKVVAWSSSDGEVASVKRIGKNTAVVSGRRAGACTVTATSKDGKRIAACSVTVTASTLPAPWAYQEINAPAVPGCAEYDADTFTLTGGGVAIERWWKRIYDQFSFVSQDKRGDWEIVARITSQTRSSPGAVAGLMFRESTARDSRFVLLGITPARDLFLSWRRGPDDEGPRAALGKYDSPIHLKLRRRGDSFEAYASKDGMTWGEPLGSIEDRAFESQMMIGLCVTARNNPTTSTATFDHVSLTESPRTK
jgi:inosine-uridine nucleoside N-ribohydrolase